MDPPLSRSTLNQLYPNDSWYIANLPKFERLLEPRIWGSVLFYIIFFQFLAYLTRYFLWKNDKGFRQYRLRNITICFVHSTLCGLLVSYFAVTRFRFMINNPVFYNEAWMDQILFMSIGYFIHDTIDMLKYELSRWTIELLVHHTLTSAVLMIAILSEKFISFAYWSLLMENNSIFLHLRTLFQLSNASIEHPKLFRLVQHTNIITFVIFRFVSPAYSLKYVLYHRHNFRLFYLIVSFGTGSLFYAINTFLFVRVLASDGYLGEIGRRYTAINRDKENQNGKIE